jgi:segregation and condensation protein A
MDFKEFLPEDEEIEEIIEEKKPQKIGNSQVYDVITSRKPDWQTIIYDLINSDQLDPLDIDIVLLTKRYFEKIEELEQADFYISSKVLLAASLLLRLKTEFLLDRYIKSIDEILFGKKEEPRYVYEKIEINEDDLPLLIPRTPLPRAKRVTLDELMAALNKAINTEVRRIKREVAIKRANKLSQVDIPEFRRIDLKDRIKHFYAKILTLLKRKAKTPEKHLNKVGFLSLVGKERDEKLAAFLPLLHLSNNKKLWLEQEKHLDEIWIYLYDYFSKNRDIFIEELEKDIEEMKEELGKSENLDENPDDKIKVHSKTPDLDELEKEIEIKISEENLEKDIKKEIQEVEKEEKIDKISGFSNEEI